MWHSPNVSGSIVTRGMINVRVFRLVWCPRCVCFRLVSLGWWHHCHVLDRGLPEPGTRFRVRCPS